MSFSYNLLCHPTVTEYLKLKQTFHSSHGITCSTIDASLPRARPHSSPRVTTALPSFTTIRFACFSSLRCANGFPCARLSGTVINGMLLQNRMGSFLNLWLWRGGSLGKKERKKKHNTVLSFIHALSPWTQVTLLASSCAALVVLIDIQGNIPCVSELWLWASRARVSNSFSQS